MSLGTVLLAVPVNHLINLSDVRISKQIERASATQPPLRAVMLHVVPEFISFNYLLIYVLQDQLVGVTDVSMRMSPEENQVLFLIFRLFIPGLQKDWACEEH